MPADSGGLGAPPGEPVAIPIEGCLDLHTFVPRDIVPLVQDYLDEAARRGLRQVRIIHGKGKGVQRELVRRTLGSHPRVMSFKDAPPEAGGWGATVACLRAEAEGR